VAEALRSSRPAGSPALLAVAWLVLATALAGPALAGGATPDSGLAVPLHEAVYHGSVRRFSVRAGMQLERQGDNLYVYRSWVEPRGLLGFVRRQLTESSLVRVERNGQLTPLSYRRHDGLGGRDSDIRFDPVAGKVHIDYRDTQTTSAWEPGIFDLLTIRLVLANDLAHDALEDIYRIIDDRSRIEEVDVEVMGRETLDTPLGRLETVLLEYRSRRRDRMYRLWIAPDLHAALVRLEQHEGGELRGRLDLVSYRKL
jgi:hypothetical protein